MTEQKDINILDLVAGRTHPTEDVVVALDAQGLKEAREFRDKGQDVPEELVERLRKTTVEITLRGKSSDDIETISKKWEEGAEKHPDHEFYEDLTVGFLTDIFFRGIDKIETLAGDPVSIPDFKTAHEFLSKLSQGERILVMNTVSTLLMQSVTYDDNIDAGFLVRATQETA